ncbi:MAG: exo-alpha-sialidase [Gemmatales bacterium]
MSLVMLFLLIQNSSPPLPSSFAGIPLIDLDADAKRQVIVDKETGQYLGHPTTVLLEDGKTILTVYPKGHGKGAIIYKRSNDGGKTWSDRIPVPENWATSLETPTIHRVVDAQGKKRLIVFSGLYPARLAVSEDDGQTWSPLKPVGDWGGIVVMGSVVPLKTPGHYLALFHDDGRYFQKKPGPTGTMTLLQSLSTDGGLTWGTPEKIFAAKDIHLCEPGAVRSPDGTQIAALLRENRRAKESHVIFSNDEGKTWTAPENCPVPSLATATPPSTPPMADSSSRSVTPPRIPPPRAIGWHGSAATTTSSTTNPASIGFA